MGLELQPPPFAAWHTPRILAAKDGSPACRPCMPREFCPTASSCGCCRSVRVGRRGSERQAKASQAKASSGRHSLLCSLRRRCHTATTARPRSHTSSIGLSKVSRMHSSGWERGRDASRQCTGRTPALASRCCAALSRACASSASSERLNLTCLRILHILLLFVVCQLAPVVAGSELRRTRHIATPLRAVPCHADAEPKPRVRRRMMRLENPLR